MTATTLGAVLPPPDEYAVLKRLVTAEGLLERNPRRHLVPAAGLLLLLGLILVGLALTRQSWWALTLAVPAALLCGQLGFHGHEAAHNQIMRTSRANYVLGLVLFNLCLGGSRGWWADKHNTHHAQPNRIGTDPDIEGGVVAVSAEESRQAQGFARFMIRRQGTTIGPLLSLSVLQIRAYSVGFVLDRRLRHPAAELGLLLAHYVVYLGALTLILGLGHGLLFALLHQLLLGVYLGGAFLPNHIGMTLLAPGEQMDFLRRQVVTSRNIRRGRVTDFMFGVLSCQIEHHLFPAMPRHQLRLAAPLVRGFCEERGIPYRETSTREAYAQVYRHLKAVSRLTPEGRRPRGGQAAASPGEP